MHRIFLSYSFRNDGDDILQAVRSIIDCAGFRVVDGKALDGFRVGDEVQAKIASCKGVVCVLSPEAHESGWVNAEFFQAVGQGTKRIFVLRHESVELPAPYQGVATVEFSDAGSLKAVASLAATLGIWKESLGNSVLAVLLPPDIGLKAHRENATCEYRCEEMSDFEESPWLPARLKPLDAAIHAVLPEVPLNHELQIKLTFGSGQFWTSDFTPQHLRFELKQ